MPNHGSKRRSTNTPSSDHPPSSGPHETKSESTSRRFPDCIRQDPIDPFRDRWRAKRTDYEQFVSAVNDVNATQLGPSRLPDGLVDDWVASWANNVFIGQIPGHDRLERDGILDAFHDVTALIEALQFVHRFHNAQRFWLYELPGDPGMGYFPDYDQVVRNRPEWNPREGREHLAGDTSILPRYDQGQFFDAAIFLLNSPTDQQRDWLRLLAGRPDPIDYIWTTPPRHHEWARRQFERVLPALGQCLNTTWPEIGETLPIWELVRRANDWNCGVARPGLQRRRWLEPTTSIGSVGGTAADQDSSGRNQSLASEEEEPKKTPPAAVPTTATTPTPTEPGRPDAPESSEEKPREQVKINVPKAWEDIPAVKKAILMALSRQHNRMTSRDLKLKAGYDDEYLRRHLSELRKWGWVDNHRKRPRGYSLTPAGSAIIPKTVT